MRKPLYETMIYFVKLSLFPEWVVTEFIKQIAFFTLYCCLPVILT